MIPSINTLLSTELEIETQTSKNYKMHFTDEVINGYRDDLDAMQQVIYKILNTERYKYVIYSKDYGIELEDLFGEPISYVCPEVQRRITEALIQDDRIQDVNNFNFEIINKRKVYVTFVVHTIFGEVETERMVNY